MTQLEVEIRSGDRSKPRPIRRNWAVDSNGKPLREIDLGNAMIYIVSKKITSDSVQNGLEWSVRLEAG